MRTCFLIINTVIVTNEINILSGSKCMKDFTDYHLITSSSLKYNVLVASLQQVIAPDKNGHL